MKKTYFALTAMLCIGLFSLQAAGWYPTKVVTVTPDEGGIPPSATNGALRDAVAANGSAIYELKRGAVYYVGGTCAFGANAVILRAEAGDGPRPIIVPFTATGSSTDVFSSGSNIRFENLYLYGLEYGTNAPTRRGIIRFSGGTEFEFENCTFDGATSSALIRFENLNPGLTSPFSVTVNKVIFRNAINYAGLTSSRGIDFRDSKGISLKVTNSTFYCVSSQMIRQGTNQIDNYIFENNTVYGNMTYWEIGTAEKASFKNNIFYNNRLEGVTTPPGSIFTLTDLGPDIPREIIIKNNLFYSDPEFDILPTKNALRSLVNNILDVTGYEMTKTTPAQLIITDTLSYPIPFKNQPPSLLPFFIWHWETDYQSGAVAAENQTFVRRETTGFVGDVMPAGVKAYDFSYPKTNPAATAGEGGTYLGAWAPYDATGVNLVNADNYFKYNFNSSARSLNITFNAQTSNAKIAVYTTTGLLVSNSQIALSGLNAEVSLPNLERGVYVFVVDMNGKAATGKFVF